MSADKPSVEQQARLADTGIVTDETAGTDLVDWGFVESTRSMESRTEVEQASEFGTDDRQCTEAESAGGSQAKLVADVEDDQQTLTGEDAAGKSLW